MWVFFFFFQAEDGIRDRDVTGVQTCALPISGSWLQYAVRAHHHAVRADHLHRVLQPRARAATQVQDALARAQEARSEERRVGKECVARGGWAPRKDKEDIEADGTKATLTCQQ